MENGRHNGALQSHQIIRNRFPPECHAGILLNRGRHSAINFMGTSDSINSISCHQEGRHSGENLNRGTAGRARHLAAERRLTRENRAVRESTPPSRESVQDTERIPERRVPLGSHAPVARPGVVHGRRCVRNNQ